MINDTGTTLYILNVYGEVFGEVAPNCSYTIRSGQQVVRDKNFPLVKTERVKGVFSRIMSNKQIIQLLKGNRSLAYPLLVLLEYLEPKTNFLMNNGKKLKINEFCQCVGITKQRGLEIFKELKALNILGTIKTTKGQFYALNPFYFNKSDEIIIATTLHFEKNVRR